VPLCRARAGLSAYLRRAVLRAGRSIAVTRCGPGAVGRRNPASLNGAALTTDRSSNLYRRPVRGPRRGSIASSCLVPSHSSVDVGGGIGAWLCSSFANQVTGVVGDQACNALTSGVSSRGSRLTWPNSGPSGCQPRAGGSAASGSRLHRPSIGDVELSAREFASHGGVRPADGRPQPPIATFSKTRSAPITSATDPV